MLNTKLDRALAAATTPAGKKYARQISKIAGLTENEVTAYVRNFDQNAGSPRLPDLDNMNEELLMTFWAGYHRGDKAAVAELFPGWNQREGLKKVVSALANYASNKSAEKACRRRGDETAASNHSASCGMIYAGLPGFARFRR